MKNVLVKNLLLLVFMLGMMSIAKAQSILPNFENFNTNGTVNDIVYDETNDLVYVAGFFSRFGPMTRFAAPLDASGNVITGYPEVNGQIHVVIPDGSGGFFIGGDFTEVGGVTRNRLAQINSSGNLTSWDPNSNFTVRELFLDGSTLYVGGSFSTIGGQSRRGLAAVDASTGVVSSWNVASNTSSVFAIFKKGNTVYVGGGFTSIGGQSRNRVAAIDATTGLATSWDPNLNNRVEAIEITDNTIYVGGLFTTVGGVTQNRIVSFDLSTGNQLAWNPNPNSSIYDIHVEGTTLYVSGAFSTISGVSRTRIASYAESTKEISSFAPSINSNVFEMNFDGGLIYIAGQFGLVGGELIRGLSAITISTGMPTSFNAPINGSVNSMALSGGKIYMGGNITGIGGTVRNNLACFDPNTGQLTSWNPDADGAVGEIILDGSSIYAAGSFTNIGGVSRDRLAKISTTTGNVDPSFNPTVNNGVNEIELEGGVIYMAGFFTSVNGATRNYAGAVNATTGATTSWNPNADNFIWTLDISENNTAYLGGRFTSMGGQTRNHIAETDLLNGAVTAWDPNANDDVFSIDANANGEVIVGGEYSTIGGTSRNNLAAIDPATGNATSWNPNPNQAIVEVKTVPSGTLYVGGNFGTIGGSSRTRTAAFAPDGGLIDWGLDPNSTVRAFEEGGTSVFAGGGTSFFQDGLSYAGMVGVTRANGGPFGISLDNASVNENSSTGALVGTFSSADDLGDTHTYTLVSGSGDKNNALFSISSGQLLTDAVFDFENQTSYSIRVRSTDQNGNFNEEQFSVSITNVIETENDILTFSIPGQSGAATIDAVNHRVELDMGFGTDKSNLTPTITTSSGSSISPLSGTPRNFSNEVNYTVTAENGSNQIWTVKIYATIPAGSYTVGSGGDYSTLVAAFTDFNNNGITGDITLEILDGHTEGLVGIPGGWLGEDTYTITTVPAAGATSITLERLSVNGAKNLVFDGQNIIKLSLDHPVGSSILAQSNSQNLVFRNFEIDNTSGSAAWFLDSDNIEVSGCSYSFGGSIPDQNIFVFRINSSTNVSYVGNTIILGPEYNSTIRGITVFFAGNDTFIANNSIHVSPTSVDDYRTMEPSGMFYHNTVVVDGPGTINDLILIRNNSQSASTVVNNNFYLDINHTTASGITTSNNISTFTGNNFYIPSADGVSTNYLNIQGTTYGPSDLAGIEAVAPGTTYSQPVFTNLSGGDLSLTGASLTDPDLRALPEALVTTDLNGATRSSRAPTKGAFEHANTVASILGISFPEQQGDETINNGTFVIDAVAAANTDLTSLSPTITAFPGASVTPASGSTHDFSSSGVVYNVIAETGGASQDWTLNITEFNAIPTDITLSSSTIDENESIGTVVGTFSTTDANSSQSHTYTLVSGTGDTDNASFTINGNQLESAEAFDFETKFGYSILVRTDDGNGGTFEKQFTITVENVAENPTNIILSSSSIAENNSINDVVGTLSSVDDDNGETYTYSLVPNGSLPMPDNVNFNINGNELRASVNFDFETKNSFLIRIRTDDNNGGVFIRTLSITISDESEAPTDLSLDNTTIQENNAINAVIGNLSTTDEDAGETYTYSLVAGTGDDDNGSFNINGSQLRASSSFDFETKDTYSVRIQTDDGNGGLFPKEFTISITNQVESPTDIGLSNNSISESLAVGTAVGTLTTTDEDEGETYTYTLVSGTGDSGNGSFQIVGDELRSNEVFDFETQTSYSVRIQTDDGNGNQYAEAFTINIGDVGPSITDIGLTNNQIDENNSTPLTVGTFSTLGEEVTGSYTYSLVSGDGDGANSSFFISGDELRTSAVFDHEIISSFSIRVRTDDGMGSFFEKAIALTVNDLNEAPTAISLSESSFDETETLTALTSFIISDPDDGDTFTVALVSGTGDSDNDKFSIALGQGSLIGIMNEVPLDFESQSSFSVRVRVTDAGGLSYEESLSITLNDVSEAPTALAITGASIDENNSINDVIGSFITSDEDAGETYTYSLVSGEFDADNGSFNISGNQLRASQAFDFESKNSLLIRVRTDDGNGGIFERGFSIDVNDVNEAPSDLDLSNRNIDESTPIGTLIGILSTTDEDAGDTHTYSYSVGCDTCDPLPEEQPFVIVGNELRSNIVFDYETVDGYAIEITSTDAGGLSHTNPFIITINDLPAQVTSLDLSNQSIAENQPSGTLIGTFATSGEDLSGSFTYALATGSGDADNASFSISGDQLLSAEAFDFESQSSFSIRVMTNDGSLTSEETFTISISDVSEAPTDMALSTTSISENNSIDDVIGSLTTTDEDAGESYTYSLVSGAGDADNSSFSISGSNLQATEVFDFETKDSYSVRIQTNDGNGGTYEEAFTITILNANENISVIAPISDQSLTEGFSTSDIDLSGVFSDEDGDALTYMASSSNTAVVAVSISGSTLTITEAGIGTSTVTVTADDGSGSTTSDVFEVTVLEGNNAPVIVNSFADGFSAPAGFGSNQISYADVFSDADGDDLSITVESSNEAVVTVELIANEQMQINEVGLGVSTITVTANDGNGGSVSDTFTFTVTEAPLALEDAVTLEIYPNPTNDYVNIKSDRPVEISLFDLRGQRIQTTKGQSVQMDLQKLSSGSYLLKITDGESAVTRRIIKAN